MHTEQRTRTAMYIHPDDQISLNGYVYVFYKLVGAEKRILYSFGID